MYDTGRSYPKSGIRLSLDLVDDIFDNTKCETYEAGVEYEVAYIVCGDEIYERGFAYFFDTGTHNDITDYNTQSGSYMPCYTHCYNYGSYKASRSEYFFDVFSSAVSEAIDKTKEDKNADYCYISCGVLES